MGLGLGCLLVGVTILSHSRSHCPEHDWKRGPTCVPGKRSVFALSDSQSGEDAEGVCQQEGEGHRTCPQAWEEEDHSSDAGEWQEEGQQEGDGSRAVCACWLLEVVTVLGRGCRVKAVACSRLPSFRQWPPSAVFGGPAVIRWNGERSGPTTERQCTRSWGSGREWQAPPPPQGHPPTSCQAKQPSSG